MKRQAPLKHLHEQGCELFREGSRHSIYWNSATRKTSSVPRHAEMADKLARRICRDLDIPEP